MVLPWALSRAIATSGTTSGVTSGTSSSAILGATLSVTLGVTTAGALLEHCVQSPWGLSLQFSMHLLQRPAIYS